MLHMNPGDDRENTLENLRELVENCYHDVFVTYHGEEYILYSDHGGTSVESPSGDYQRYDNYDEMLKDPVFEGKTLAEIINDINATY